ncbi:hypothetical protein Tco_1297015, partial [Tanacetum coccineum]
MEKAKTVVPPTQKKRRHDDNDQDPPAGPNHGLKERKTHKDAEPSKRPKSTGLSKGTTQSQLKPTGKSVQAEETVFEAADTDMPLNQGDGTVDDGPEQDWLNDLANIENPPLTFDDLMRTPIDFSSFSMNRLKISKLTKADLVRPVYNLLKGTCKSCVKLECNMEECYRALSDQLDWNNPEGNHCPYDLNKPLPLHESRGRLTVPVDFFFNDDLEYLRGGSTNRKYTASITKTKAAKYEIKGIEDMVPKLWSPIKVAYDKYAALGISYKRPKRQRFYGHMISK